METETTQAVADETQAVNPASAAVQDTATSTSAPAAEQAQVKPGMTQDELLAELKAVRAEAAKYRTAAKQTEREKAQAEANALKEQGNFKKLYEQLEAEHTALKAELAKRERTETMRRIAEKVGLNLKWAERLRGETEEEMEADAIALLADQPKVVVRNDAKQGGNGTATSTTLYGGMTRDEYARTYGFDPRVLPER